MKVAATRARGQGLRMRHGGWIGWCRYAEALCSPFYLLVFVYVGTQKSPCSRCRSCASRYMPEVKVKCLRSPLEIEYRIMLFQSLKQCFRGRFAGWTRSGHAWHWNHFCFFLLLFALESSKVQNQKSVCCCAFEGEGWPNVNQNINRTA